MVFRAFDPVEGRLVAIKAFRLDLIPERAAELARALEALPERGLAHPSIAAPIGAGVEDGIAWFAQAYVPAESLDSALRQYGPPPVSDVLTIVTQLAGALDFAAAASVAHGSLHPRDVLVAPGETHLVDLGVAAALESCGVRAPVRLPYSAPERTAGGPISRAGDIFALGAIAFELLSGQPVTGAGEDGIVTLPDVPGADREALLETFSFALALAPDERYPTALAFAAPLKRALGDALTRPAAPRKRRTPRPAGALLPIDDPEPDTFPARSAPVMPIVDGASPPPRYDDAADFGLRPSDPADHAAPSYLSGPTEPEPSAPAIEPIAAPGDVYPMTPAGHAGRDAAVDDEETVSSGDAVQLSGSEEPFDRWDMPGEARADGVSRLVDGDIGRPDAGRYGVDDALDYSLGDNPNYAPDRHAPYEPPAGNFAAGDYAAALDEDATAPRAPWLAFAALLLAGIVAGLAGGWFLFSGRGERSASAVGTAQSESGNTPSRNTGAGRYLPRTARSLPPGHVNGPTMRCGSPRGCPSPVPQRRRRGRHRACRRNRVQPRRHRPRPRRVGVSSSARVRPAPASKSAGEAGASRPPRSPTWPTVNTPCV